MSTTEATGDVHAHGVTGREFWLRHGLPGLVGTSFIAIGSLGVGWLPLTTTLIEAPFIELLRSSTAGTLMSRSFVFIGAAVLLQTWLVLGFDLLSEHRAKKRWMAWLMVTWSAPLLLAPPIFSRDTYSYYEQGRLMAEGYSPYEQGVAVLPGWFSDGVDPMWGEVPTPYGPFFLLVERGVYVLTQGNPLIAALLFRLTAVVGIVLLLIFLPRLARVHDIDPDKALWIGVLNPLIVLHFVAAGHNDALMTGLLVMAFALACEKHPVLAAAALALAASVKPIALLALVFLGFIWAGQNASWPRILLAWLKTGLATAVVFMLTALVAGVGFGWIAALGTPGEVRTWLSPATAIGMLIGNTTKWLGLTETNDGPVTVLRIAGLLVGVVLLAVIVFKRNDRSPTRNAALAFATVVVFGPVIHPWYLLWFLPLFAATGLTSRELKITILLTAAFTFHAMSESSTTSDNFFELTDGISLVAGIIVVAIALLASPRERQLVLGEPISHGILPERTPAGAT